MLAGEICSRRFHAVDIRAPVQNIDIFAVENRLVFTDVAGVTIGFAERIIAGVETGTGQRDICNRDVFGKILV